MMMISENLSGLHRMRARVDLLRGLLAGLESDSSPGNRSLGDPLVKQSQHHGHMWSDHMTT